MALNRNEMEHDEYSLIGFSQAVILHVCTCVYMCVHVCVYACICMCMCVYACTYVCMCVHVCTCV